jgi:hypothetical protein
MLISLTYQNLISNRLFEYSKNFDKLSISVLSRKLAMNEEQLFDFINLIQKRSPNPIRNYNTRTQEIIFKKPRF